MEKKLNPVMILFLGASVAIGATTSLTEALTAGVAVLAVMVLSSLVCMLINKLTSDCKMGARIIVVAAMTTVVSLLMRAFFPFDVAIVYIASLSVNLLVFCYLDESVKDAAFAGFFFLVLILMIGAIRELFGAGSIAGYEIGFLASHTVNVLNTPAGGLLITALVMALFNKAETKACICKDGFLKDVFNNKKGENE